MFDSKELEGRLLDKEQFVFDAKTEALLDKLERENFKRVREETEGDEDERRLVEAEIKEGKDQVKVVRVQEEGKEVENKVVTRE